MRKIMLVCRPWVYAWCTQTHIPEMSTISHTSTFKQLHIIARMQESSRVGQLRKWAPHTKASFDFLRSVPSVGAIVAVVGNCWWKLAATQGTKISTAKMAHDVKKPSRKAWWKSDKTVTKHCPSLKPQNPEAVCPLAQWCYKTEQRFVKFPAFFHGSKRNESDNGAIEIDICIYKCTHVTQCNAM